MNRTTLDRIVAAVVGIVVLLGGASAWQAAQSTGRHMGSGGGGVQTHHSLWMLVGTLVVAGVIVAIYLGVRSQINAESSAVSTEAAVSRTADSKPTETAQGREIPAEADEASNATPSKQLLELLPDDERRILQPVVDSPGLTQIELRDRASFSKSKISQTVTDLEKRGLLYREPQGRTYRIYPGDELSAGSADKR